MAPEEKAARFWSLGGFLTRAKFIFKKKKAEETSASMVFHGAKEYKYRDLCAATNNFDPEGGLGSGGVKNVYRGVLKDGSCVAVKIIPKGAREDERDFIAELGTLGYVRHRNLVPLRGWCITKKALFLVYELMANGSLDQLLFGRSASILDWGRRYRLVCGLADGLSYLHEGLNTPIVHRDLKASNVMVDADWNARLGDFGLARLTCGFSGAPDKSTLPQLHAALVGNATGAGGTFGYTAPECFHGRSIPTVESDVFSFGLVVLEIVCGRRAVDYVGFPDRPILVDWVRNLQEWLWLAVDESLGNAYELEEAIRLLQVGLLCSHSDPMCRPNMRKVVHICSETHEVPELPSFSGLIPYETLLGNAMSNSQNDSSTRSWDVAPAACLRLTDREHLKNNELGALVGSPQEYSWREILKATKNFSRSVRVGGRVYKGTLSDGSLVAIKRLELGPYGRKEFLTEIEHLGRIRHKNVVPLKGWCLKGSDEACLIYEYMPNGNVGEKLQLGAGMRWEAQSYIYEYMPNGNVGEKLQLGEAMRVEAQNLLGWGDRFCIVSQVAEALRYLHEGCERSTVHLDVKPSNVLLDKDLNARLSGLWFASFAEDFDGSIRGTIGYIAPEMLSGAVSDVLSPAVDVYSFGMLVLVLVSGRWPLDGHNEDEPRLDAFIWRMFVQDRLEACLDANLHPPSYLQGAMLLLRLGLLCIQREPQLRPTMRVVTDILTGAIPCPQPPTSHHSYCFPADADSLAISRRSIDCDISSMYYSCVEEERLDPDSCGEEETFSEPN